MNAGIQNFLDELVAKYDCVDEIWLFGSRANKKDVYETSDWDFLIFGNKSAYSLIKQDKNLSIKAKDLVIGLLVQREDNKFTSPWKHKGRLEQLTLTELNWKIVSETKAEYWGYSKDEIEDDTDQDTPDWMKPRNQEEEEGIKNFKVGCPTPERLKAIRVWSAKNQKQIILDK